MARPPGLANLVAVSIDDETDYSDTALTSLDPHLFGWAYSTKSPIRMI